MGRVLLVCDDSIAIQHLSEGMQQLAIATEVCVDVSTALRSLNRKKFEAVIIDLGLTEADQVLGQVRLSPSNRTAVTFAITDAGKPAKPEIQANFMIEKPLSAGSVGRILKAAFGLIVRERRRSFRCPTETFSNPRDQNRRNQLPPGQYQRGRPGHHRIARPEARDTGSRSLHAARPVASFPD